MNKSFAKYRLLFSKLLLLSIIIVLLISENNNVDKNSTLHFALEFFGFAFLLSGVIGRIWSSLYIEGKKTNILVTDGIYSVCRNPLYFFSFILLIGFFLLIKSIIISVVSMMLLLIIYPKTIKHEEDKLLKIHGQVYSDYILKTPKLIPNFLLFKRSSSNKLINVNIKKVENVLVESFGFILFFELIRLVDYFHEINILPTLFTIF